jgi:hypothetical protein
MRLRNHHLNPFAVTAIRPNPFSKWALALSRARDATPASQVQSPSVKGALEPTFLAFRPSGQFGVGVAFSSSGASGEPSCNENSGKNSFEEASYETAIGNRIRRTREERGVNAKANQER